MNVLIVDNYDSFTYNLFHLVDAMVQKVIVVRNDCIDFEMSNNFDKIILSPGPGLPSESPQLFPFIDYFHKTKSILGVCLGHQAIGEFFGCKLLNLQKVKHGEYSSLEIIDPQEPIFRGLNDKVQIGHYHSWVIDPNHITNELNVTSTSDGLIMSISHKKYDLKGLQFHPESVLTPQGAKMLSNWLML